MTPQQSEYFVSEALGTPTKKAYFQRVEDVPAVNFAPGLTFRPTLGDGVLVNHVFFDPHTEAPTHAHEEEQVVVVLEGELDFWINEDTRTLHKGDMVVIPAWVPHGARTRDSSCLEIDIFCPPRRQLLAFVQGHDDIATP